MGKSFKRPSWVKKAKKKQGTQVCVPCKNDLREGGKR
jgi:hypothetical protein